MRVITELNESTSSRVDTSMNLNLSEVIDPQIFINSYREELLKWLQKAIAYFFFFILLQLSFILPIPRSLSLFPLFCLDLQKLFSLYISLNFNSVWRYFLVKEVVHQVCSITFKVMLMLCINIKSFSVFSLIAPVFITSVYDFIHKASRDNECTYLTWLVRNIYR